MCRGLCAQCLFISTGIVSYDIQFLIKIMKFPDGRSFPPEPSSFTQVTIGTSQKQLIPAYTYWNLQFYQPQNQYVLWVVTVPRGASIGLYARRNALPTHTHYDILQILRGFKTNRSPRISFSVSKHMRQNTYFLRNQSK